MNKTTTVRARIEPALKRAGDAVLLKIGLSPSDAITLFYQQISLRRGLPFSVNVPNAETAKVIRDANRGIDLYGPISFEAWSKEVRAMKR